MSLITLDRVSLSGFLIACENWEIQKGGSEMATAWNHDVILTSDNVIMSCAGRIYERRDKYSFFFVLKTERTSVWIGKGKSQNITKETAVLLENSEIWSAARTESQPQEKQSIRRQRVLAIRIHWWRWKGWGWGSWVARVKVSLKLTII